MSVLAELGKLGEVGERANNTNLLVLSAFLNTESIFIFFSNIIFDTFWALEFMVRFCGACGGCEKEIKMVRFVELLTTDIADKDVLQT